MKVAKIFLSLLLGASAMNLYADKLHVISFYNTDDPSIGENKKAEMAMMSNEFQSIATSLEKHGYTTELHFFDSKECKKNVVINTISSLEIAPEDVVFFYYGGHGVRLKEDLTDFFPLMCLNEKNPANYLRLSKVEKMIEEKNPRLTIVMAGCCNSVDPNLSFYMNVLSAEGPTMESELEKDGYYHLFNDYQGTITMSSSKAGQVSYSGRGGGVFCLKLMENFANVGTGVFEPEWNNLCSDVKSSVEAFFKPYKNMSQEPFYVANVTKRTAKAPVTGVTHTVTMQATPATAEPAEAPKSSIDPNMKPMETTPTQLKKAVPAPDQDYVNKPVEVRRTMTINNMESAYKDINSLLDTSLSLEKRIELVPTVLQKHFAKNAKVKTLGRNMTTVVDYEDAEDFLNRVAMSPYISKINIVEENGGKNEVLTVHEIRKK